MDCMEEGVVALDANSTIVFVNESTCEFFGYAARELIGQPLEILLPGRHRDMHAGKVEQFRRSGEQRRMMRDRLGVTGLRKDGTEIDVEISIAKSQLRGESVVLAVIRDVSERRRVEARLRASEERLRAILRTCSDAVLLVDVSSGAIIEANGEAASLFEASADRLTGRYLSELLPDLISAVWRSARTKGGLVQRHIVLETEVRRSCGSGMPVEVSAGTTELGGEAVLVAFVRNITHHKLREAELISAKEEARTASESKTRFLANVSHELRTPLNAIIGMSEIMRAGVFGEIGQAKYREYVGDIHDSGLHLLDVINDILDFSRLEIAKVVLHDDALRVADVVSDCRRTVRRLMQEAELSWRTDIAPDLMVRADSRALRQMLLNLLSNAIKHTPEGGSISVTGRRTSAGGIAIEVADTGAGIPVARLAFVTEPFNVDQEISVSTKGGTGLGLSITKRLLELHEGTLEVDSAEGVGTVARLVFPAERTVPS